MPPAETHCTREATPRSPSATRLIHLDVLRGALILLVILWHTQGIDFDGTPLRGLSKVAEFAEWSFYFWISLLAVPTFLVISLWLYKERRRTRAGYLGVRAKHLLRVLIFWGLVQTAVVWTLSGGRLELRPLDAFMGGPALPVAGDSVLYFITNLLLLLIGLEAAMWVSTTRARPAAALALALIGGLYLALALARIEVPYWSPISFLPAIPIALLMVGDPQLGRRPTVILGAVWLGAIALELTLSQSGYALPTYARISPWVGSVLLLSVASAFRGVPPRWLAYLGTHTLGLLVLHKYAFAVLAPAVPLMLVGVGGVNLRADKLIVFALTLAGTVALAAMLQRSPLRRLV